MLCMDEETEMETSYMQLLWYDWRKKSRRKWTDSQQRHDSVACSGHTPHKPLLNNLHKKSLHNYFTTTTQPPHKSQHKHFTSTAQNHSTNHFTTTIQPQHKSQHNHFTISTAVVLWLWTSCEMVYCVSCCGVDCVQYGRYMPPFLHTIDRCYTNGTNCGIQLRRRCTNQPENYMLFTPARVYLPVWRQISNPSNIFRSVLSASQSSRWRNYVDDSLSQIPRRT